MGICDLKATQTKIQFHVKDQKKILIMPQESRQVLLFCLQNHGFGHKVLH